MIVWFTGQPGSGKSTLAAALAVRLRVEGRQVQVVDGDDLRQLLPNPGYDCAGRVQNVDRAQAIAAYLDQDEVVVLVALVAPYRAQRDRFKRWSGRVIEVYLHTDERRGKEQYHVADYEAPTGADLDLDTGRLTIEEATGSVHRALAAVS